MKTQSRTVAGLAMVLLTGVGVWAAAPQARNRRPTLSINGQPGGRVRIIIDIPGKELFGVDVRSMPNGELLLSKEGDRNIVTVQHMSFFIDALPAQGRK